MPITHCPRCNVTLSWDEGARVTHCPDCGGKLPGEEDGSFAKKPTALSVPSPATVACPRCGSPNYAAVSGSASRAPGRITYRVCATCAQPYLPPTRFRIAKAVGFAVLAILLCVGGDQAVAASAPVPLAI